MGTAFIVRVVYGDLRFPVSVGEERAGDTSVSLPVDPERPQICMLHVCGGGGGGLESPLPCRRRRAEKEKFSCGDRTGEFCTSSPTSVFLFFLLFRALFASPQPAASSFVSSFSLPFSVVCRRYNDAIRVMSQLLIFVSRQRSYLSMHFYQQASMNKTVDRMYILVMLCSSLCNVKLDESVNQIIKEKYSDKFYK